MFEKPSSVHGHTAGPPVQGDSAVRVVPLRRVETALKVIEWCDLTARLEAARDLRVALRHEARRHIEDTATSFTDAAAQYFRTLEQSKHPVNLAALDAHKGSGPIVPEDGSGTGKQVLQTRVARDDAKDEQ